MRCRTVQQHTVDGVTIRYPPARGSRFTTPPPGGTSCFTTHRRRSGRRARPNFGRAHRCPKFGQRYRCDNLPVTCCQPRREAPQSRRRGQNRPGNILSFPCRKMACAGAYRAVSERMPAGAIPSASSRSPGPLCGRRPARGRCRPAAGSKEIFIYLVRCRNLYQTKISAKSGIPYSWRPRPQFSLPHYLAECRRILFHQ